MLINKAGRSLASLHSKQLCSHHQTHNRFTAWLQGKSPFPFAIAELVDNSLRALQQGRKPSGQITVSMVLNNLANPSAGLLSVWDNGAGMTKLQLNQWAVMNLSMEDRGLQPREGAEKAPAGVGRFLAGNLSYFGVRHNLAVRQSGVDASNRHMAGA